MNHTLLNKMKSISGFMKKTRSFFPHFYGQKKYQFYFNISYLKSCVWENREIFLQPEFLQTTRSNKNNNSKRK